jgi:prepilin-type N-terminal cleavage/methylation domain-containing protein
MRAFTLVEILVAAVILSIVIMGIYMVLNSAQATYYNDTGFLELQRQARSAMSRMLQELRCATTETISSGGAVITFNTLDASGVSYYRNAANSQLIREYPSGSQQAVASSITNLSFCCWHDLSQSCDTTCTNSNLVEVSLTASGTFRGRSLTLPLKGQVRIRNE